MGKKPFIPFKSSPLRKKLIRVIMATCTMTILLATGFLVINDFFATRQSMVRDLSIQANIIGANSVAALAFHDHAAAQEILEALRTQPSIMSAILYSVDGQIFTRYRRSDVPLDENPLALQTPGHRFHANRVELVQPIIQGEKTLGLLYLQSDLEALYARLRWFALLVAGVMFGSLVIAFFVSLRLQRSISTPILNLSGLMQSVSETQDYSVRVTEISQDEIGTLVHSFHHLLEQIHDRDQELQRHRAHLEEQVVARTAELSQVNQELKQGLRERKLAEEALRESQSRYHKLVDSIEGMVWEADPETFHFTFVSSYAERLLGYSPEQWVRDSSFWADHLHPEDRDQAIACCAQAVEERRNHDFEYRMIAANGKVVWIHDIVTLIFKDEGLSQLCGIMVDVTERKRLESQIRQKQKMEAIGTLAGGIAHDFNNILAAILGYSELAFHKAQNDKDVQRYLQEVRIASHRAKDLVHQILAFSHPTEQTGQLIDLPSLIKEGLRMLRATLPSSIQFRSNINVVEGNGWIMGDPTQVHQILMNLFGNSEYAMRDMGKGLLEIGLEELMVNERVSIRHPGLAELTPGTYFKLTVSDTGQGISPEVMPNIFDPFFTTKGVGEGTGMGLSVVHGIITSYGGLITVSSQPGQGATFDVYLPKATDTPAAESVSDGEKNVVERDQEKKRILFVEDEEQLARLGKEMLEQFGYEAEVYTGSLEALEAFRAHPDHFDAVVTDQTMPQMTGERLAEELLCIRPDIPVIVCTGFSHTFTPDKAKALGIRAYLLKPLGAQELADVLAQALNISSDEEV